MISAIHEFMLACIKQFIDFILRPLKMNMLASSTDSDKLKSKPYPQYSLEELQTHAVYQFVLVSIFHGFETPTMRKTYQYPGEC